MQWRWKHEFEEETIGNSLSMGEREELERLRKENRNLLMEKEILKKRVSTSQRK